MYKVILNFGLSIEDLTIFNPNLNVEINYMCTEFISDLITKIASNQGITPESCI